MAAGAAAGSGSGVQGANLPTWEAVGRGLAGLRYEVVRAGESSVVVGVEEGADFGATSAAHAGARILASATLPACLPGWMLASGRQAGQGLV